jgi:acyl-coenzyme A synthetase/AMP-(fatty) acid ligase
MGSSSFYINSILGLDKKYIDYLTDITNLNDDSQYICENDTYLFFVKLAKKLVNNEDFLILDGDFTANEISTLVKVDGSAVKSSIEVEINNFSEFINLISNSNSKINIFTSGTTGNPKKVTHTINSLTRSVKKGISFENDIWGFAYNPTHMAGLQVFFQCLINKNTLVDLFKKERSNILTDINKYRITNISATPTFYRLLLPFETEFESVKRITFGGEKSDSSLYTKIKQFFPFAKISNIYASTEIGALLNSEGEFFKIPLHLIDKIKILENELCVESSLLGKSEEIKIVDNYYHTGDIVEFIDEGKTMFKFISRKSDYVNVGGYKVNLGEIESEIFKIDGVNLVSVSSKPNSVLGNIIIANIVKSKDGENLTEQFIRTELSQKLQDFKIPRKINFVSELNYNRTGKLNKI